MTVIPLFISLLIQISDSFRDISLSNTLGNSFTTASLLKGDLERGPPPTAPTKIADTSFGGERSVTRSIGGSCGGESVRTERELKVERALLFGRDRLSRAR